VADLAAKIKWPLAPRKTTQSLSNIQSHFHSYARKVANAITKASLVLVKKKLPCKLPFLYFFLKKNAFSSSVEKDKISDYCFD
jgi:hypothetical protein